MERKIRLNPKLVVERLRTAFNDHNVDALVDCCDSFYLGEEPAHPNRAFRGREKGRTQWSAILERVPNFQTEIVRTATDDDVVWTEWYWHGRATDKTKLEMRGVTILGVKENRIMWSRIYMEPVQAAGPGLEAAAG